MGKNRIGFLDYIKETRIYISMSRLCGKEFKTNTFPKTVFEWNIVAATLHTLEALSQIVILAVYFWSKGRLIPEIPLSLPVSVWSETDIVAPSCYEADDHCTYVPQREIEYNDTMWKLYDRHVPYIDFNVEWAVVGFFFLSSFFQFVAACGKIQKDNTGETYYDYEAMVSADRNPLRFIEYSISASLMLAIITAQSGVQNFHTLFLICICCTGTQLFGLVSEYFRSTLVDDAKDKKEASLASYIRDGKEKDDMSIYNAWFRNYNKLGEDKQNSRDLMLLTHGGGFLLFLSAYGVIISHFYTSNGGCGNAEAPEWIEGLVWGQFLLFSSFGVVQMVSIVFNKTCRSNCGTGFMLCQRDVVHTVTCKNIKLPVRRCKLCGVLADIELSYIALSLVAKSLLCWTLFAYVLVELID